MRVTHRAVKAGLVVMLALTPLLAHPQVINDLLKSFQQRVPSDLIGAIKSITEIAQGQVTPGEKATDADGKVVLFRTAWCGYCKRAAAYMQQKSIPFVERDIEVNPAYKAEYTRLGGKAGVPFIVFGEKTMQGFSEASFDNSYDEYKRNLKAAPNGGASSGNTSNGSASPFGAGDTMIGKIAAVPVYLRPTKSSPKLTLLGKADEAIYMGDEREGMCRVTTPKGEGWIDKLLVRKP